MPPKPDPSKARVATSPHEAVLLRPLGPDDQAAYLRAFDALSAESRLHRFGVPKPSLTRREIEWFTTPDGRHHVAIAAWALAAGEIVGVGRYVSDAGNGEVAVTVIDAWQRRGLGARVLSELIECARATGLGELHAYVGLDNDRARRCLRAAGFTAEHAAGREFSLPLRPARGRARR